MSKWGVFTDQQHEMHVIPCTGYGRMLPPHELGMDCICRPKLKTDKGGDKPVWVHEEVAELHEQMEVASDAEFLRTDAAKLVARLRDLAARHEHLNKDDVVLLFDAADALEKLFTSKQGMGMTELLRLLEFCTGTLQLSLYQKDGFCWHKRGQLKVTATLIKDLRHALQTSGNDASKV